MKRCLKAIVTLLCIAALAIVAMIILVPALLGLQRYVIVGSSMTGTIDKGSVVYSRLTPVSQLNVGDIITFTPPGYREAVTHRIIAIEQGQDGKPVFRTKGDSNPVADPWKVNLAGPSQARYVLRVPYVGYVLAALAIRQVRMVLIGLPALLIALSLLWSLWKQAGDEVVRQGADSASRDAESSA